MLRRITGWAIQRHQNTRRRVSRVMRAIEGLAVAVAVLAAAGIIAYVILTSPLWQQALKTGFR